jgi:hypothetical protein
MALGSKPWRRRAVAADANRKMDGSIVGTINFCAELPMKITRQDSIV